MLKIMEETESLKNFRKAQVGLPFTLLVGGIVVALGLAGALVAYLLSSSTFTEKLSNRALAAAKSGVNEALMNIVDDKNYTIDSLTINTGLAKTVISVEKDPPGYPIGTRKIISIGKIFNRQRKLVAIVSVSPDGQVNLVKLEEK